jgi:DNA repair protein SbcD/Mre11
MQQRRTVLCTQGLFLRTMTTKKKLRVLHTSDWHLGQKLTNLSREPEQELALDWLLETIIDQSVDALIVSGDVFDTYHPSVSAETLYYRFLARLYSTPCRHVVIIGGNHDSPARLNAPKPLLNALNMHIVGQISDDIDKEIIVLKDASGQAELVIAAVPFLREQHLAFTETGLQIDERRKGIRTAIQGHFAQVAEAAKSRGATNCPHICMAHLCIGGQEVTEEQSRIYLGDTQTLSSTDFDPIFDYVALGHIHRAQKMNATGTIRYCGSMIPLSFSELEQKKLVYLIDFEESKVAKISEIAVPIYRRLVRIKSSIEEIGAQLKKHSPPSDQLSTWAEVLIESTLPIPQMHQTLQQACQGLNLQILKHSNTASGSKTQRHTEQLEQIEHLDPQEVFERKCLKDGYTQEQMPRLIEGFRELREWMEKRTE